MLLLVVCSCYFFSDFDIVSISLIFKNIGSYLGLDVPIDWIP